jgi:hypothetical protein
MLGTSFEHDSARTTLFFSNKGKPFGDLNACVRKLTATFHHTPEEALEKVAKAKGFESWKDLLENALQFNARVQNHGLHDSAGPWPLDRLMTPVPGSPSLKLVRVSDRGSTIWNFSKLSPWFFSYLQRGRDRVRIGWTDTVSSGHDEPRNRLIDIFELPDARTHGNGIAQLGMAETPQLFIALSELILDDQPGQLIKMLEAWGVFATD